MLRRLLRRTKSVGSEIVADNGKQKNIIVVKGDIATFQEADVLVNPISSAASDLRRAGFVSDAFYEWGKDELQKKYEEVGPPKRFGIDVSITESAGLIRAKKIFHVAIGGYRNKKSLKLLTKMIKICLTTAESFNMTSIAFPAVDCGNLRYRADDVAHCFLEAARQTKLQIYVVAYTSQLYETFTKTFHTKEELGKCEREANVISKSVVSPTKSTPPSYQTAYSTGTSTPSNQVVSPTSSSLPSNPFVSPSSSSLPSNQVASPSSSSTPANQVVSPTSPSTPSNQTVSSTSPPLPSNQVVSPTSPSTPSNQTVSSTSPSLPSNQVVSPTNPSTLSNQTVSSTSPSTSSYQTVSSTSSSLPSNQVVSPSSPSTRSNETVSSTSMSASSNPIVFPPTSSYLPSNPVVSPSGSSTPSNQTAYSTGTSTPSNQVVSPTSSSTPANQTVSTTGPSTPSNQVISPISPSTPSNETVSSTSPPIYSNPVVSPTSSSTPSNQAVSSASPSLPSNQVVFPTNPSTPSNETVSSTSPPTCSNPVVAPSSSSLPSNQVVSPTSSSTPSNQTASSTGTSLPSNQVVSPTSSSLPSNQTVSRCRPKLALPDKPPALQKKPHFFPKSSGSDAILDDILIEMSIYHSAIANLTLEFIWKIQELQSQKVQTHFGKRYSELDQLTATLTGSRKLSLEVKQRILKLLAEDEVLEENLDLIKHRKGVTPYLIALSQKKHLGFPDYWQNLTCSDLSKSICDYHEVVKGSPVFEAVEALITKTWDYSLVGAGRNARGLTHSELVINKIWTVENPLLYTKYQFQLKALAQKGAQKPFSTISDFLGEPEIKTTQIAGADYLNSRLISEVNEVYLLHGTTHVDGIAKSGIDCRLAADQALFGRGAYFAESSTKSDQYADQRKERKSAGEPLHMFVARVLLGEPFIARKARPDLKKAPCSTMDCKKDDCSSDHPMCDSVIGTHKDINTRLLFREFIVYHPDQCYPEFLVEYQREY